VAQKATLRIVSVLVLSVLLTAVLPVVAEEEAETLPVRFSGTIIATGSMVQGMTRVTVTVEEWSSEEARKELYVALRDGGTPGLVKAMDKLDVGYIQINNSLGYRLRSAASWETEKGRFIRVVTDRPIAFAESWRGTRSQDYPIGVVEFLLPPGGPGEGTLLAASQVDIDEEGRIEVKSLPNNTGPQKLTNIEQVKVKAKKKKKKKKSE
jgi:hypothetical protein